MLTMCFGAFLLEIVSVYISLKLIQTNRDIYGKMNGKHSTPSWISTSEMSWLFVHYLKGNF